VGYEEIEMSQAKKPVGKNPAKPHSDFRKKLI